MDSVTDVLMVAGAVWLAVSGVLACVLGRMMRHGNESTVAQLRTTTAAARVHSTATRSGRQRGVAVVRV